MSILIPTTTDDFGNSIYAAEHGDPMMGAWVRWRASDAYIASLMLDDIYRSYHLATYLH